MWYFIQISKLNAASIEFSPRLVVTPSTSKDWLLLAIRKNYDYRVWTTKCKQLQWNGIWRSSKTVVWNYFWRNHSNDSLRFVRRLYYVRTAEEATYVVRSCICVVRYNHTLHHSYLLMYLTNYFWYYTY